MKDDSLVVLDEELVSSHTKEDRGTWVAGGDMTLLLPLRRLSQEVTSLPARGSLHHNVVSKRRLDTFGFSPSLPVWERHFL